MVLQFQSSVYTCFGKNTPSEDHMLSSCIIKIQDEVLDTMVWFYGDFFFPPQLELL